MSFDGLPPGYDAWRTSGPPEAPVYDVKVELSLHFDSVEKADQAQKLMESKDFDFQERKDYEPGQPTLVYTTTDEANDYDYDHHVRTEMVGPEIMALTCDHEISTDGFPVEYDPDDDRDYGMDL
jgi:hypothetical protein